jgi:peptide methionine sulfoxide reductase msrA/msrB
VSLSFQPQPISQQKKALFASGCFWGTEYFLARIPGVIKTTVGYAGGHLESPDYESVCSGTTGHVECVEVVYDPAQVSYETLCKLFFETHDFTQKDGQGPDIGSQYLSRVFCQDEDERRTVGALIQQLKEMGYSVATEILGSAKFWPAEEYHRQYYERQGKTPYCHAYRPVFKAKK